jgi:hypothetical protein
MLGLLRRDAPAQINSLKSRATLSTELFQFREDSLLQRFTLFNKIAKSRTYEQSNCAVGQRHGLYFIKAVGAGFPCS